MNIGRRVMVMGSSGSGKSTMAKRLGEIIGLPVVHLDSISWLPGWVAMPEAEFDEKVREAADEPAWVIDGNYSRTRDYRLERADTVIYLDFSRYTCLLRALKRRIMYHGRTRPDIGEGCPERITWWLVKWIWTYPRRKPAVLDWLSKIEPPKKAYRLQGNRAVERFLSAIANPKNI